MGKTNNSTIKLQDVIDSGGIRNSYMIEDFNKNQLIKDIDITTGRKNQYGFIIVSPLFHNVTLKNEYGDNHLTKFQDLNIAETYSITLNVSTPLATWTGYTLYGFTAEVIYPNGTHKSHSINITETTTDKSIEIEDCIDNARVKISKSLFYDSGATMSSSFATNNAKVEINPIFTVGDGVTCTGPLEYPCFDLKVNKDVIDPIFPDSGSTGSTGTPITPPVTTRKIDIYISTVNVGLYRLLINTAKYGTGTTLSQVQDHMNLLQAQITELSREFTGITISPTAVQATIEVPKNAYVAIYLSDPSGSASNMGNMALYSWEEGNYQYVSPGSSRASVTYTVNTYQIH
jgi:hypothetical protein